MKGMCTMKRNIFKSKKTSKNTGSELATRKNSSLSLSLSLVA